LQNRVRPDGALVAINAKGLFTGNRGILHDPDRKTLSGRRWTTSAWICCSLEWKGRRRDVWGRNRLRPDGTKGSGWSELFFLDEVTALAAGHRPCHFCRNADAKAFHAAFCFANGELNAGGKNKLLHDQRWQSSRAPATCLTEEQLADLPDAAMVSSNGRFFALKNGYALPWTFEGYSAPVVLSKLGAIDLLQITPASIIGALREGYRPRWHASALL